MNEKNLSSKCIETVNDCEIYRCEAIKYDPIMGTTSGHIKVYYDVVIDDVLLDSFKTLREAKLFAKAY